MAKTLLRNIVSYISSKLHRSSSKVQLGDEVESKQSLRENIPNPSQKQKPNSSIGTTTVKDMRTGEYSQAEVMDIGAEYEIEKSSTIPKNQPSQIDKVKLRARNEAYIKAVRGLMVMKLDADIFTDAMDELREKYFGKGELPDEVATIVENLTQKVNVKQ